ncbi:hypothetical protein GCM10022205_10710 [Spinactinospora alkalitolerans]
MRRRLHRGAAQVQRDAPLVQRGEVADRAGSGVVEAQTHGSQGNRFRTYHGAELRHHRASGRTPHPPERAKTAGKRWETVGPYFLCGCAKSPEGIAAAPRRPADPFPEMRSQLRKFQIAPLC